MDSKVLLLDIGIGLLAGYAATKVIEGVQPALYRLTPQEVQEQEEAVRPGLPSRIAARKTAAQMGIVLRGTWLERAAAAVHCGTGLAWGPVYGFLRRFTGMSFLGAGLTTGAAMSLIVDEGLSPALGFNAPNHAYPLATHVRGLVTHLVFGLAVAVSAEALYQLAPDRLKFA